MKKLFKDLQKKDISQERIDSIANDVLQACAFEDGFLAGVAAVKKAMKEMEIDFYDDGSTLEEKLETIDELEVEIPNVR